MTSAGTSNGGPPNSGELPTEPSAPGSAGAAGAGAVGAAGSDAAAQRPSASPRPPYRPGSASDPLAGVVPETGADASAAAAAGDPAGSAGAPSDPTAPGTTPGAGPGTPPGASDAGAPAGITDPDLAAELAEAAADLEAAEAAAEMEVDLEVAAVARQRDEYLDSLRRVQADFENYRKRTERQRVEHVERAVGELVNKLLPVCDTVDLAIAHGGGEEVKQIWTALFETLERAGLERIDPDGGSFDPTVHDAVAVEPGSGTGIPEVVEVMRAGYRWKGRVLRPAMVKVKG